MGGGDVYLIKRIAYYTQAALRGDADAIDCDVISKAWRGWISPLRRLGGHGASSYWSRAIHIDKADNTDWGKGINEVVKPRDHVLEIRGMEPGHVRYGIIRGCHVWKGLIITGNNIDELSYKLISLNYVHLERWLELTSYVWM